MIDRFGQARAHPMLAVERDAAGDAFRAQVIASGHRAAEIERRPPAGVPIMPTKRTPISRNSTALNGAQRCFLIRRASARRRRAARIYRALCVDRPREHAADRAPDRARTMGNLRQRGDDGVASRPSWQPPAARGGGSMRRARGSASVAPASRETATCTSAFRAIGPGRFRATSTARASRPMIWLIRLSYEAQVDISRPPRPTDAGRASTSYQSGIRAQNRSSTSSASWQGDDRSCAKSRLRRRVRDGVVILLP